MKSKTKATTTTEPKLRMHTRGFPIWIRDGKLIDPNRQVVEFLSQMLEHVEGSGEIALQATMEVKILTKRSCTT